MHYSERDLITDRIFGLKILNTGKISTFKNVEIQLVYAEL